MSTQAFSRGRPVYGGGSFAPTRGQVSAKGAQGYLKREMQKRGNQGPHGGVSTVGRDGQSDTRSGVVKAALGASRPTRNTNSGLTGTKTPFVNGGRPIVDTSDPNRPGHNTDGPSTTTQPPNGGNPATPPQASTPPQVIVGPTGTLQLPYSQQFSAEVLAALDDYNNQILGLNMEQQQADTDYTVGRRDAGVKYGDVQRTTLSGNAAAGTAYSSKYGVAVGKNAQAYQNQINDMDTSYNLGKQKNELSKAGMRTAFNRLLAQSALDYGNDLAGDAGNLGYGTSNVPLPAQPPKPPKGPRGPKHNGPKHHGNGPKHGNGPRHNGDWTGTGTFPSHGGKKKDKKKGKR